MAVYISTESGRHYLVGQSMGPNSLRSIRIDTIKEASLAGHVSDYDAYYQAFSTKKNQTWNGSFNQQRLKQLTVLLRIKEGEEDYLMLRLEREQRMGHSQRIDRETVKFEIELTDFFAINPFLRTFIGRIIAIESTDSHWRASFIRDLDQLISLYSTDDQKESLNHDH